MTTVDLTLDIGRNEFDVTAQAHTYTTRYDGTWCDGPAMVEVEGVTLHHTHTGKPIEYPFSNLITPTQWGYIEDAIAEAHGTG